MIGTINETEYKSIWVKSDTYQLDKLLNDGWVVTNMCAQSVSISTGCCSTKAATGEILIILKR